jgi:hypothetical protein
MTLKERLTTYKAEFESKVPPEKLAIMHRANEDLRHSGILEHVTKAGDSAPEFLLTNLRGEKVSSSVLLGRGSVVVTFYRGVW